VMPAPPMIATIPMDANAKPVTPAIVSGRCMTTPSDSTSFPPVQQLREHTRR